MIWFVSLSCFYREEWVRFYQKRVFFFFLRNKKELIYKTINGTKYQQKKTLEYSKNDACIFDHRMLLKKKSERHDNNRDNIKWGPTTCRSYLGPIEVEDWPRNWDLSRLIYWGSPNLDRVCRVCRETLKFQRSYKDFYKPTTVWSVNKRVKTRRCVWQCECERGQRFTKTTLPTVLVWVGGVPSVCVRSAPNPTQP